MLEGVATANGQHFLQSYSPCKSDHAHKESKQKRYHIWQNGGVYHPVRFADLEQQLDEDGEPTNVRLCPVCKGPMEFWAN